MQPFWDWFIGEAGAAWIMGLLGLMVGLYSIYLKRSPKPKPGNHIVCKQVSLSSHLRLSERARKLVNVEYIGESQQDAQPIGALSQTFIDIRNESEIDALYNIELEFHVLNAQVLSVEWLSPVPVYPAEQSEPSFHARTGSPLTGERALSSHWEIHVPLAQLASYEKYGESFRIEILADGDLNDIRMPLQGNIYDTSPVWRAKYVSLDEYLEEQIKETQKRTIASILRISAILIVTIAGLLWITFPLYGPLMADLPLLGANFLVGLFVGIFVAGIFGYLLQQIQLAYRLKGARNRRQEVSRATPQTPAQAVLSSIEASFGCLMWAVALLLFLGAGGYLVVWYLA